MGFPLALGTKKHFSPISTQTNAASGLVDLNRFDNKKEAAFFILDKPSIDGYSGGPVFLMPWPFSREGALIMLDLAKPEGQSKCVGIVHGTISDKTGGKLSAIIPSFYIVDLITRKESKLVK